LKRLNRWQVLSACGACLASILLVRWRGDGAPRPDACARMTARLRSAPPGFTAAGDYPSGRAFAASNGMQGVTHDGTSWYFTAAARTWRGVHSRIWKVPLTADLNQAPPEIRENPFAGAYNHLGELVHVNGKLYVALERGGSSGRDGAFAVFNTALEPYGFGRIPDGSPQLTVGGGGFAPWIAYNPKDGLFYSSRFDSAQLHRYAIAVDGHVGDADPRVRITYKGSVLLRDGDGNPTGLSRMQSGKFSSAGRLYIAGDVPGGGIYVVDPDDGRIQSFIAVTIDRGWKSEELEGMDLADLGAARAPGITSQIHVIVLENNLLRADAWSFRHFAVADFARL
jgi:hypothetical protein